ncbi:hypothetical protein ACFODO_15985 [Acinetobacter sichuanensis]|uniref:Uncharacterized protein n=1 Tax=Acinetobacter sichuanensis TaxID=2136183 RepID=A0A371YVD8_9GAMM|nr:hypothetical protein [Acinetobacter sichuanensis]RFC85364.1 hypothetical protein C9E89_000085 [Acinetobacter sichuanensis]
MPKNIDLEEERRNELSMQMLEDLKAIATLEQRPIKYFKMDENGIFCEVQILKNNQVKRSKDNQIKSTKK